MFVLCFFFFSSRRRHTRCYRDWSSDVCSSDLTISRDGWPRISPCELDFVGGQLTMGMMWRSPKALDLLRGSPLVVHSIQADRHATEADIKLYGRAGDVSDPATRGAYRE